MESKIEDIKKYIPATSAPFLFGNATAFEIPATEIVGFVKDLNERGNFSLKLITATDERGENGSFKIWYIFGAPKANAFLIPFVQLKDVEEFPSLVSVLHGAGHYERQIRTFFGLKPVDHPDSRPAILQDNWPDNLFPLRKDFSFSNRPKLAKGKYHFQKVRGEGIYEIPVGPIHAGIIEPGHFRFSVAGEEIMLLEPRLGFVHKGSEKLFERLSLADKIRLSEKISGDSSFSHSLAFCQAVEELADVRVSKRARYLRTIFAELERLANHFGDIGAIMIDTGFNFGGAQGARLREMVMRINERLTGSRFLRGVNAFGGVTKDINASERDALGAELEKIAKDFDEVISVAEDSVSLLSRLKGTGTLPKEVIKNKGIVGVAGRAAGVGFDTRADYPYAAYDEMLIGEIPVEKDGDVYARFRIRIKEVAVSMKIIQEALRQMPEEKIDLPASINLKKNALSVGTVEGWRGEIIYFVTTDSNGNISRVAPRDPSVINWPAVGRSGVGNVVPDFPLINKSFNLSYSGNDL